ncbi:MAG: ABC transporter permease [Ruminococcus sp.]|nr:ABC transporter permease [Ruminococcus sp.]
MNRMLYPKLAASNIKKNAKTYVPYIITCILTVAMYYIMESLSGNEGLNNILGADTVSYTLELGSRIVAIFAFIFLFYTNSFLTKNRKKEFGLFNILGMEKKHISKVIGFESIYVVLISLSAGFLVGILLDKLMYLVITKLIKAEITLGFYISKEAILHTLILFGILFLIIFLNSLRMIHLAKPIELLKGGSMGEKEPKSKWLIAILGLGCLGGGYYISLTVENPIAALSLFFVAVILVVVGTYLIFTASSISFLKLLKKNKRYYYKTNHFISVSGMIYRMKQNAVGLANICILSTMVLVMVSSTASLIIGTEDLITERYPYEIAIESYDNDAQVNDKLVNTAKQTAQKENIKIEKEIQYSSLEFTTVFNGKDTFSVDVDYSLDMSNDLRILFFITAEDYSDFIGKDINLKDDEVIIYSNRNDYNKDKDYFKVFGKLYKIVDRTDKFVGNGMISANITPTHGIVVKDISIIKELYEKQKEVLGDYASNIEFYYGFDTGSSVEKQTDLYTKIKNEINSQGKELGSYDIECRESRRDGIYGLYGSLFFLGIFLGLLFIMATVLIIYYKQISEGYEDKKRFEIMQKVGMSEQEVKGSIRSQVLTVFFLPLITAGIHVAIAFPIISKILLMLNLTNTKLYVICTIASFLVFTLIYGIIYLLTAKVYYRIVKK